MKKQQLSFILFVLLLFTIVQLSGQVSINTDGSFPDNSAILDAKATNKGFLPPRVALTAINSAQPITSPAIGLFVYNTANSGSPPNNVTAGYYCWAGTKWIPVLPIQGTNNGDMQYWNGTTWILVPAGLHGQQMYFCNGVPTWGGCSPILTTTAVSNIAPTSVTSGGNITSDCGAAVTDRGVCWNTSAIPTNANSRTYDGNGTGTFASNLTVLTPGTTYYIRAFATNSNGTAYGNEVIFTSFAPLGSCGSLTINHVVSGGVAPVDKTVTYSTVTNVAGEPSKCWITKNLGADYQAYYNTDCWESVSGWYWQFNRKKGYNHDGTTVTPSWTITSISENSDWIAANDPCKIELGAGWRIPTKTEWGNIDAAGNWSNWNGPWNSGLFLNAAGYLAASNGSKSGCGSSGCYWSNAQGSTGQGKYMNFYINGAGVEFGEKASGQSVRCIKDVSSAFSIGQSYGGGKIFYIDGTGQHGLIATTSNQATEVQWYNGSFILTGASGTGIGAGNTNTNLIVAGQGAGNYAAKLCFDLVLNGYSDWYLPSKDELDQLYINRLAVGGFTSSAYWSSSEDNINNAWKQHFDFGFQYNTGKYYLYSVRAIRAF
ncbi:MAG: DUF1566 domain-containing protein [Bacteroidetes bacterium]|nr:DUF1566 domain-containing protein [Bacteroidota bacterium]